MVAKKHTSMEGLKKIIDLRTNLNKGLFENLNNAFSNIVPVARPVVPIRDITNPEWLRAFVEDEGCFHLNIQKSGSSEKVWLLFQVTQHYRDTLLMESLIKYLNYGRVSNILSTPAVDFQVTHFSNINDKIIPFFKNMSYKVLNNMILKIFMKQLF